ncbi:MAG: hypothetical protein EZS28_029386 [Streblomastix strix]|uniref:Uncharacterized protein n=1 Tax=Streblomastix strix TaxID=222440 RepID=A0A5J4UX98_9EUKA|nr:MAG: hypothetical protein EZS28_029386 [Streblomastix strix]
MQRGDAATQQPIDHLEHIKLWIGYSTACGPFQQIAISKDKTKLWETSIYAREQAMIAANSLSDECSKNSVSVSSLETIVSGRRHGGIFLDIPVMKFATTAAMDVRFPVRFESCMVKQMATDDSFMRGYNSSKMGARTNIQVTLQGNLTPGIVDSELIKLTSDGNQNNLI